MGEQDRGRIHGITLVYTVVQAPSGTVLGTATFVVSHEIELSATGLEIDDHAAVTLTVSTPRDARPRGCAIRSRPPKELQIITEIERVRSAVWLITIGVSA